MSSVSLQDSQLQFYDAIEYFTSDTETDDDSDQETSDVEPSEQGSGNKSIKQNAIVPGALFLLYYIFTSPHITQYFLIKDF